MKKYVPIILLSLSLITNAILTMHFSKQVEKERIKVSNISYNLQYETLAHDEDVLLLKRENHTLQNKCGE